MTKISVHIPSVEEDLIREIIALLKQRNLEVEIEEEQPTRDEMVGDLQQSAEEIRLHRAGKITLPTLRDVLDGL